MEQQNFFPEQLVGVAEMMKIQTAASTAIKQILTALLAEGIQAGLNVTPTTPAPSLAVLVKAGQLASKAGAFVVLANDLTIDLTAQGVVGGVGGSRWITILAVASQVSDTPVVTPGGVVQYRTFDSVNFQLIFGAEALAGQQAIKPGADVTSGGIVIADVKRIFGQASFQVADIDMTRAELWLDLLDIVNLINNHVSAIDHVAGLQAALDGKAALNHGHNIADVLGLQASLDSKLTSMIIDAQVNLAPVLLDGTNKVVFSTFIPKNTIKAGKGIKITLRFSRPVGHNPVTYNLLANGNGLINFPAYAPVAGVQGNQSLDAWNHFLQNFPAVTNAQILTSDALINAAPAVGGGGIMTPTSGAGGCNIDWTLDQTISWVANGAGPDTVGPALWIIEHLK